MTEDEAKTKWCPHARQAAVISNDLGTGATANRDASNHYGVPNVNCIASACMAWRWGPTENKPSDISTIHAHMVATGCGPLDATGATSTAVKHGYCGLAGALQ
jgi:hypothetical protein